MLIGHKALPRGTYLILLQEGKMVKTLHSGHHETKASEMVYLRDLRLPKFNKNKRILEQKSSYLKVHRKNIEDK